MLYFRQLDFIKEDIYYSLKKQSQKNLVLLDAN